MNKKFWLAAVAAYVVLMVYGFAVYGGLLASYVKGIMEGIGRTEMLNWPHFFRLAIIALVMAFMYPKRYKGGTPWLEGLRFGLLIAILLVGASALDFYATLPIAGGTIVVIYIPEFIGLCITGIVMGAIYGKIAQES
ncbi:MAG: hypothetical protein ACE5IW_12735 [bacterium]